MESYQKIRKIDKSTEFKIPGFLVEVSRYVEETIPNLGLSGHPEEIIPNTNIYNDTEEDIIYKVTYYGTYALSDRYFLFGTRYMTARKLKFLYPNICFEE